MWIKKQNILYNMDTFKVIVADDDDLKIKADTKDGKIITLFKARTRQDLKMVYDRVIGDIVAGFNYIFLPEED